MTDSRSVPPDVLARIAEAIQSIQFGSIQITIHNAQVVQIEKAEKIRLHQADLTPGSTPGISRDVDRTSGRARPSAEE